MGHFKCSRCGNEDPKYIGVKNNAPYCRLCVSMNGRDALTHNIEKKECFLNIKYELTNEQKEISNKAVNAIKSHKNTLIYAVCGAGKTELVFASIQFCLSQGLQVGFAIPRREVVIEIYQRLKRAFPSNSIVSVYGGNNDILEADIIVLTTHQLYRYCHYFDLLILDEIDAFPFKENALLSSMFLRSVKGNYILMSATPSQAIINEFKKDGKCLLTLRTRFHNNPIPVPQLIISIGFLKYFIIIRKIKQYIKSQKQLIIFSPTIDIAKTIFAVISKFCPRGEIVHSKRSDTSKIINDFKNQKYDYLVSTAILERGITIKGLQVIIFGADSDIFDEYSLVQIAGRVGRDKNDPKGEVIFLANKGNASIKKAINTINESNLSLQKLF